ncbi:MAG: helix-turn-helix transcriptional regulator [Candidatus Coatesbacteria bacterium]|nr:MAG: helix-turn-helix transcriptional regulator [Candidatus Coatesbacteria bacterium]
MRVNGEITFGRILRGKRAARGFTQRELADRAGVDASYISQLERDHKSPSSKTLLSLADALDVEVAELLAMYLPEQVDESPTVFVGREDIINGFADELDRGNVGVIVLEGITGSGRTFLIRNRLIPKCREANARYVYLDGARVAGYRELLLELRERFPGSPGSYIGFDEMYAQCSAIEGKLQSRFNDPFGVPVSPVPGESRRSPAPADELTYAEKYIYKDMERLLTGEFLSGFGLFVRESPKAVVFVDDYDRLGPLAEYWFRELLGGLSETGVPGRDVVFVLSVERPPRSGQFGENVISISFTVPALTETDVKEYARAKGLADQPVEELLTLGGHPLSVALWADYLEAESLYRNNKLGAAERVLERLATKMRSYERDGQVCSGRLLRARVNRMLGHLARFEGRLARADGFYAAAAELYDTTGEESRRDVGYVLLDRGNVCRHRGLWDDALKYYREAGEVFAGTDGELGGAVVHTSAGTVLRLKGDFASAKTEYEAAQKTLTAMVTADDDGKDAGAWLACTLSNLSITYRLEAELAYAAGDDKQAAKTLGLAEALCEEAIAVGADAAETAVAKNRLGLCCQVRGAQLDAAGNPEEAVAMYDRAEALHQEALVTFEENGDKYRVAQIFGDLGTVAVVKGSDHDAVVHFKNSLALFRQMGSSYHIAKMLVKLGSLGRGEERLGYFSEALSAARRHNTESFDEIGKAVYEAMDADPAGREKLFSNLGPEFHGLYVRISEGAAE